MSSRPNGGAQTAAPKRRRPEVTYPPLDLKPKFDYNRPMIVIYLKLLLVIYNITSIFTRLKLYRQCSKWTGTHRNGVPVREMERHYRSVSKRYAGTHRNAVPVRHLSEIVAFSILMKFVIGLEITL